MFGTDVEWIERLTRLGRNAAVVGISYALGMLSGWTIVGMLRRSLHRITDRPIVEQRYAQVR